MLGRLLETNIATIEKDGKHYSCDLRAIPLPQGGEGKRLYCHLETGKLSGLSATPRTNLGKLLRLGVGEISADEDKYICDLHETKTPTGGKGKRLYCHKVKKKKALPSLVLIDLNKVPGTTKYKCYGKVITGLDFSKRRGYAIQGNFISCEGQERLKPGDTILWYHEEGSWEHHYPHVEIYKVVRTGKREGKFELLKDFGEMGSTWSERVKNWIADNLHVPIKE